MKKAIAFLFTLILIIPCAVALASVNTGAAYDVQLKGYANSVTEPELSSASIWSGKFQSVDTSRFEQELNPGAVSGKQYAKSFDAGSDDELNKNSVISGVSYKTGSYMWTRKEFEIVLEDAEIQQKGLLFCIEISGNLFKKDLAPVIITIFVNGDEVYSKAYSKAEDLKIRISPEMLKNHYHDQYYIKVTSSKDFIPAEINSNSNDSRHLALKLKSIGANNTPYAKSFDANSDDELNKNSVISGVSYKTGNYMWTRKEFEIVLEDAEIQQKGLLFGIEVSGNLFKKDQDPVIITISVNGDEVYSEAYSKAEDLKISIPPEMLNNDYHDYYYIKVTSSKDFIPAEIDSNSEDSRQLALKLKSIGANSTP